MGVTIKDIAKRAGVSVTSVSYALNNSGSVSKAKKELIFQTATELEYIPNGIAKSLQSQRMGFVGYFTYALSGPVFSQITRGIEDVFASYGQEMIACNCSPDTNRLTRLLTEKMIDGAIIFAESIEDNLLQRVSGSDCPIVVLDRALHSEYISSLLIDNQNSMQQIGFYLHKQGFKNVGCLLGGGYDGNERRKGFFEAAKRYDFYIDPAWILHGDFHEMTAYSQMKTLLKEKNLPEVFFAFSDEMAIGAIHALEESGYRIPDDISIVGMDDIPLSSYITPKLTTIHRPMYELGQQAAHTLYHMLHHKQKGTQEVLPTYLIERESCSPKSATLSRTINSGK